MKQRASTAWPTRFVVVGALLIVAGGTIGGIAGWQRCLLAGVGSVAIAGAGFAMLRCEGDD